jgi:hypothetical protein
MSIATLIEAHNEPSPAILPIADAVRELNGKTLPFKGQGFRGSSPSDARSERQD